VRLDELLGDGRELLIRHGEEVYHLRVTRNGRLLLTK
jgi:hemin uptake protein HemP